MGSPLGRRHSARPLGHPEGDKLPVPVNSRRETADKGRLFCLYLIGSIPLFHWQPEGFRSFLELSLLDEAVLGVGAGQWGEEIMITPENVVKAC